MKQEKPQARPQIVIRMLDKYLLRVVQLPLLVTTGLRNWKMKTVPVGRSFMRFPRPVNVLSLKEDDEDDELVIVVFGWMCWFG